MTISKCQYCFLDYNDCTCCKYCSLLQGTCDCHLEGEWPCTKLHPSDSYKALYQNPEMCNYFGYYSLDDIDKYIMSFFLEECWPERLKTNTINRFKTNTNMDISTSASHESSHNPDSPSDSD